MAFELFIPAFHWFRCQPLLQNSVHVGQYFEFAMVATGGAESGNGQAVIVRLGLSEKTDLPRDL